MEFKTNTLLAIGQVIEVSTKVGELKPGKYITDGISIYHEYNSNKNTDISYFFKKYDSNGYDWTVDEKELIIAQNKGEVKILDEKTIRYLIKLHNGTEEKETLMFIPENVKVTKKYIIKNLDLIRLGIFDYFGREYESVPSIKIDSWEVVDA